MPSIGDYTANAAMHSLYTRVSQHFYNSDILHARYVVHASREVALQMDMQLQITDAKILDACWKDHPDVLALCLRGW